MFHFTKKNYTICLVGAGGKTTVMYELAHYFSLQGRRVLVLTSTHIMQPKQFFATDEKSVQLLWQKGNYAVIGTPEKATGKLTMPERRLYTSLCVQADIILCEADGAKHLPCKAPAAHEPVILPECDTVIAVCGMDALDKPLQSACFRSQLASEILNIPTEALLTEENIVCLLTDERALRKNVGKRSYYIVLNKCDTIKIMQAENIRTLLMQKGVAEENIWLRGKW